LRVGVRIGNCVHMHCWQDMIAICFNDSNYVKLGFLKLLAKPIYIMQQHDTDDQAFVSSGGYVQM
jgi:hypothetical protein